MVDSSRYNDHDLHHWYYYQIFINSVCLFEMLVAWYVSVFLHGLIVSYSWLNVECSLISAFEVFFLQQVFGNFKFRMINIEDCLGLVVCHDVLHRSVSDQLNTYLINDVFIFWKVLGARSYSLLKLPYFITYRLTSSFSVFFIEN